MSGNPHKRPAPQPKKERGASATGTGSHQGSKQGGAPPPSKDAPKPLATKSPNVAAPQQQRHATPSSALKDENKPSVRKSSNASASQQQQHQHQHHQHQQNTQQKAAEGKDKERVRPDISVVSHAQSHGSAKGRYITIKAKAKRDHPLRKSIRDIIKLEKKREAKFKEFLKSRNALKTSFMPNNDDDGAGNERTASPDYMNFLNLEAFGDYGRMYTEVSFGENPGSEPVDLVIDTGSAVTWVNKTCYDDALAKTKTKPGLKQEGMRFVMAYHGGTVEGDLVKDQVRLRGIESDEVVMTYVFGVVDEEKFPDAKRWREEQDIPGIIGLGDRQLAKGAAQTLVEGRWKKMTLPTIMDKLLQTKYISDNIVGIRYGLPDEGNRQPDDAASQSSGSQAGTMGAHFHLGDYSRSSHKPETLRWIPVTTVGSAAKFSGVDLELKYGNNIIMAESPGIVDSGAEMISLPEAVLDAWLAAVNEGGKIVKYDEQAEIYHMKKED